eukprot:SAG11_NODE_2541_length_3241_cov_4.313495_2_plen_91_part_00
MERNIALNQVAIAAAGGRCRRADLTWGEEVEGEAVLALLGGRPPDLVLMSDVVYQAQLVDPLCVCARDFTAMHRFALSIIACAALQIIVW